MKIEIDYNGAFAVCRIEPMEELGKMVNFNEAVTIQPNDPLYQGEEITMLLMLMLVND